jgi:hypothetical protein
VEAVLVHRDDVTGTVTIDGEQVETTPEHPFAVEGEGFVAAADLVAGEKIRRADGGTGTVDAVSWTGEPAMMWNLTVAEDHTFFVGEGRWWVHNDCSGTSGETLAAAYGREVHASFDYGPGFDRHFDLPSGRQVDAINPAERTILELKPDRPRAIQRGLNQLSGYLDELNAFDPDPARPWVGQVVTYPPYEP